MNGLHPVLLVFLAVCCSHDCVSASVLEVIVRPGENATLYCDCKISPGVYIAWYRICSHENQPPLVLKPKRGIFIDADNSDLLTILDRFQFVRNFSSESYDLLIHNITVSEEGIYYCGTGERRVEDKDGYIVPRDVFSYSNTTARIILQKHSDSLSADNVPHMSSWMLPIIPAITVLSSLISFILVYLFCQKTESQRAKIRTKTRMISSQNQDKDVCWTQVVFLPQDA
ncbi:uncharacterized protein LOC121507731 isoform X1 [Cheilinus undulatus]|uniref:uncharacterized protein LOC121507731 isoform X1 n=1 Tax=Cheilinus undulatus TaxID=241271 RepID=UPI001BD5C554|nr:uncharacterized protein LOC121507731 isoform X1 [Cheilinus undulatus]